MNERTTHRSRMARPWMLSAFAFVIAFAPPSPVVARIWISLWIAGFTWWTLTLGKALRGRMPDPKMLNETTFQYKVGFAALYVITIFWVTEGGYQINSSNAAEYGR